MQFLKKAKDLMPSNSLKYLLHQHFSNPDPARPLSRIHASDVTKPEGFCPRYYALHDVGKTKPKDRWLNAADVVTYDMGNFQQDQVVHAFADMNKVIGDWKCNGCDKVQNFQARPGKCPKCGCKSFKPVEIRMLSDKTGVSCGIDMLAKLGGTKKLQVVELKTMIKDQFKSLLAPLAEHRLRTNLYLRTISESTDPNAQLIDTQTAKILYVCKGGYCEDPELAKWGLYDKYSPFKEYTVTRDDTQTDKLVRRPTVVRQFRAGEVGMPCGICPTALVKRALICDRKTVCFSGEHPPVYEWEQK